MTLGQIAYEAYRKASGGVSLVTRTPLPEWVQLQQAIRDAWDAAAEAVAAYVRRIPR